MKAGKYIFLALLFCFYFLDLQSQNITFYSGNGKIGTGINVGSIFQCSDVYRDAGPGFGATLERRFLPKKTPAFSFSLRGRYLTGWSYGLDFNPSYGIVNNKALNGGVNPKLNYLDNSTFNWVDSFVYANHRTHLEDFSLEGIIYANKLRENYKILLYVWGGMGMTGFKTKIDQLDRYGNMYDYDYSITASPGDTELILTQLRNMLDGKYETYAEGISKRKWVPAPNLGIGLGFQISPRVSIGVEHKITFPFTDLLDGQQWTNANLKTGNNDVYHYTILGLRLLFGGGSTEAQPQKKDVQVTEKKKNQPPVIIINQPATTPYTSPDCTADILASILYVPAAAGVQVFENDAWMQPSLYSYDPSSKLLKLKKAISGETKYKIVATNAEGSATKELIITCKPTEKKPVITIITPTNNPYTASDCMTGIKVKFDNIASQRNIGITKNGVYLSPAAFTFNSADFTVSINEKVTDKAVYVFSATNEFGNASRELTVICPPPLPKPVIKITQPTMPVSESPDCQANVKAMVSNLTVKGDLKVSENGLSVSSDQYSFDPKTGTFSLSKAITGRTTFTLDAYNSSGSSSASVTINCTPRLKSPVVTLVSPLNSPHTVSDCVADLKVKIENIQSASEVEVFENNIKQPASSYSFNPATGMLTLLKNFGTQTVFRVVATTKAGTSAVSMSFICDKSAKLPVVTITQPTVNPYNARDCKADIKATVLNVTGSADISITANGIRLNPAEFSYNATTKTLSLTKAIDKSVHYVITANNSSGTASANVTINCIPAAPALPTVTIIQPNVNPFLSPDCKADIRAEITNVTSVAQISVFMNNIKLGSDKYSFDMTRGILSVNQTIENPSSFRIQVTTPAGNAQDEVTINCVPKPKAPLVTITQPTVSPYNAVDCQANIRATVQNIENSAQVSVFANGQKLTPDKYTFNISTGILVLTKAISTTTTYKITATTAGGTASDEVIINCTSMPKLPAVSIVKPTINPYNSIDCIADVVASVKNVENAGQVSVFADNIKLAHDKYVFDAIKGEVTFKLSIIKTTLFKVTATTAAGSATAQVTINCTPPQKPPSVSITKPATDPFNAVDCIADIVASILNIDNASQTEVFVNNTKLGNEAYTWNAAAKLLTFKIPVEKTAVIKITATNSAGSSTAQRTIHCTPPPKLPEIIVIQPIFSPYEAKDCKAEIKIQLKNVESRSQISISANASMVPANVWQFDAATGMLTLTQFITRNTTYRISVNTTGGSAVKDITINCTPAPKPPVLTLISPADGSAEPADCYAEMKVKIDNFKAGDSLLVLDGSKVVPRKDYQFDYTTGILTIKREFPDATSITVKAFNKDGNGTVSATFKCNTSERKPYIEIINPATSPFNTSNCYIEIVAKVMFIEDAGSIKVLQDGKEIEPQFWTYNATTGMLTIKQDVYPSSTFTIMAVNKFGQATKMVVINCVRQ